TSGSALVSVARLRTARNPPHATIQTRHWLALVVRLVHTAAATPAGTTAHASVHFSGRYVSNPAGSKSSGMPKASAQADQSATRALKDSWGRVLNGDEHYGSKRSLQSASGRRAGASVRAVFG